MSVSLSPHLSLSHPSHSLLPVSPFRSCSIFLFLPYLCLFLFLLLFLVPSLYLHLCLFFHICLSVLSISLSHRYLSLSPHHLSRPLPLPSNSLLVSHCSPLLSLSLSTFSPPLSPPLLRICLSLPVSVSLPLSLTHCLSSSLSWSLYFSVPISF